MMKRILQIGVIAIASLVATAAGAADLGGRDYDPPVVTGRAINWSGFHLGLQGGYSSSQHDVAYSRTSSDPLAVKEEVYHEEEGCTDGYTLVEGKCYANNDTNFGETGQLEEGATDDPKQHHDAGWMDTKGWADALPLDGFDISTSNTAAGFISGIGSDGLFGGLSVGADIQRGKFVFGLFGDYNFSAADARAEHAGNTKVTVSPVVVPVDGARRYSADIDNSISAKIDEGDSWLVAARAGYLFGSDNRALLYGLIGYGQQDVKYTVGSLTDKETFGSLVLGAGGEYALTNNIFVGLEGRYWFGDDKTVLATDDLTMTDDWSKVEVMARLRFKLNGGTLGGL
jgi:opacity protein-like surface antigen